MKAAPLALLALLFGLTLGQPALAKPPVWVVRDDDSTLTLFGSVHLLPPGLDWRPQALDDALGRAQDLWFEIPMDGASQSEASAAIMARGMLPKGQTLSALLKPAVLARLKQAAETLGLPFERLDAMKPWLADATLAVAAVRKEKGGSEQGVERTLEASVPAGAARRAFETGPGQVAMFDSIPLADQIAGLETSLEEMNNRPDSFKALIDAWMSGDVAALDRMGPGMVRKAAPGLYAALVTQRNAAWIKLLRERLAGAGQTVVVVGAGHLVGEDSLPAQLRALGYRVEGPQ